MATETARPRQRGTYCDIGGSREAAPCHRLDKRLGGRCGERERPADHWVERHYEDLLRFCVYLTRCPGDAEDLAQEVVLMALRKERETDEEILDRGRWLRGIARVLLANQFKKKARYEEVLQTRMADLFEQSWQHTGHSHARLESLRRCLEQLKPVHRKIVLEVCDAGSPSPQVANRLGLKAGALRTRLHRLRVHLKDCILRKLGVRQ